MIEAAYHQIPLLKKGSVLKDWLEEVAKDRVDPAIPSPNGAKWVDTQRVLARNKTGVNTTNNNVNI